MSAMFKSVFKIQTFKHIRFSRYSTKTVNKTKGSNYANRRTKFDFSLEFKQMRSILPTIVDEVVEEQLFYHKIYPELKARYSNMLNYMCKVDDDYLSGSLLFLIAYKYFEKPSHLTEENLKKACILAWCFRLQISSVILDDDIIDNSKLRYKKPVWYALPDVGVNAAICDASFFETSFMLLLLNHFSSHPQLLNIQREMIRGYSSTMMAVYMDSLQYEIKDFERYQNYIKGYPNVVSPVVCAMYLANIDDQRLQSLIMSILMDIGEYLKNEDDFNCVFQSIEKDCTDAAEGRPTWLAVQVIKRGTEPQKQILEKNYSKYDKESLMNIYNLYKEMGLEEKYEQYKEDFYETTLEKIQNLPKELSGQLLLDILDLAMLGKLLA